MNQALIDALGVCLRLNVVMVERVKQTQLDGRMLFVQDLHRLTV
jgi:hypothetical protein